MNIVASRPNRRPKLFLPLFLSGQSAGTLGERDKGFPLSPDQLRRTVAEMIG
jgi:hypothetical protein